MSREELVRQLSELEEIEMVSEPSEVFREALRIYQELQLKKQFEDAASRDEEWSVLAHQVVGHEERSR